MEPHAGSYELLAASSLSRNQLEVFRLFQMCGLTLSNEKFQVGLTILCVAVMWLVLCQALWQLVSLNIPTSYIMDLLRDISVQ